MTNDSSLPMGSAKEVSSPVTVETEVHMKTRRREEIDSWLVARIAAVSKLDPREISVDTPFVDFHITSFATVTLTNELSKYIGEELSMSLLWEYPTIDEVSRYLASAKRE
jgi:acyl carrier protein